MANLHLWICLSFVYPMFHGFCSIIDGFFMNDKFKSPYSILFYSALTNMCFLPIILFFGTPQWPETRLWFYYFLLAFLDFIYLIPYYKSLKNIDTSIVGALFSLGRVFIPILTFIFLDERLHSSQYLGFALIIAASLLLSIKNWRIPVINAAFWLMLASSSIRSVFSVLEKYTIDADGNWVNMVIIPSVIGNFFVPLSLYSIKTVRAGIKQTFPAYRQKLPLFLLQEFFSFTAYAVMFFVLPHISATTKSSISATMPIFVLFGGLFLNKILHLKLNENVSLPDFIKKLILFVFLVYGVRLVIN